ncbi:MAG: hypothetical protein RBR50_09770, partial [Candidatus Izemoplasmatales bacterium]|nr:hypothetical protein [Candidatus Izemoplasmatales bacterium]
EVLQAFHGQEITIDIITIGYRTDKLVFYGGFFGTEADVLLVSTPLTDLEKIDYDINSSN